MSGRPDRDEWPAAEWWADALAAGVALGAGAALAALVAWGLTRLVAVLWGW